MDIQKKLAHLPNTAGIYIMKDQYQQILYIGKSKHLKKRVRSYFYASIKHPRKIQCLMRQLKDIEYEKTDTELEALLLECRKIKSHQPPYNRLLKKDPKLCYLVIDTNKIKISIEEPIKDKIFYGPYPYKRELEKVIEFFRHITWKDIQQCEFDYVHFMQDREYIESINGVRRIFEKDLEKFKDRLWMKMKEHAQKLEFELAEVYKQTYKRIKMMMKLETLKRDILHQVSMLAVERIDADYVKIFFIKGYEIYYEEKINIKALNEYVEDTVSRIQKMENLFSFKPENMDKKRWDALWIVYEYLENKKHKISFIKWYKNLVSKEKIQKFYEKFQKENL